MKRGFPILTVVFLLLLSCSKIDKAPAFLYIPAIQYDGNDLYKSHKIADAWIYANGNFLGIFGLPADIPILEEGKVEIIIDPGVREFGPNGPSVVTYLYPDIYPFYERITASVNLLSGRTDTLRPTTRYKTSSNVVFSEDFEGTNNLFRQELDQNPNTAIVNQNQVVKSGLQSGMVNLDTLNPLLQTATIYDYKIPSDNRPTYLEMDYIGETNLEIGLIGKDSVTGASIPVFEFVLLSKNEWTKAYINLTSLLATNKQKTNAIAIRTFMIRNSQGVFTKPKTYTAIDNVRLIYRNQ